MPCLDVEAEAIQQAVDRRELQSAGMGLVSPGVASSSGVVWFLLGFGFSWGGLVSPWFLLGWFGFSWGLVSPGVSSACSIRLLHLWTQRKRWQTGSSGINCLVEGTLRGSRFVFC